MKKFIILISAILFILSCSQSKEIGTTENNKSSKIISDSVDESEAVFALTETK